MSGTPVPRAPTLVLVHDPMCSWCWAFRPVWQDLLRQLPATLQVQRLLGGLAADSDAPMSAAMQRQIAATWRHIEQVVPGCHFNHDFWQRCAPRRSTWRACRAVLAARAQGAELEMIEAIQHAYYLQAQNPSDHEVLVALAAQLGLDAQRFAAELDSPPMRESLMQQISTARSFGGDHFPSLFLLSKQAVTPIPVDYVQALPMLAAIRNSLS